MGVNANIILWIKSFLTERRQYVRFKDTCSPMLALNTGDPQGCVLSALLFILYTYDCKSLNDKCIIIKYADDTVIVGLINKDDHETDTSMYFDEISNFHDWCDDNFLNLNAKKTKEMIIDFSKCPTDLSPVSINDEDVEIVHEYKYLGTIIDDKLKGTSNVKKMCKKANQRLYFLRKLKDVNSICCQFLYSMLVW